jgi:hypothetical protein
MRGGDEREREGIEDITVVPSTGRPKRAVKTETAIVAMRWGSRGSQRLVSGIGAVQISKYGHRLRREQPASLRGLSGCSQLY